jgi:hypothetical protein
VPPSTTYRVVATVAAMTTARATTPSRIHTRTG